MISEAVAALTSVAGRLQKVDCGRFSDDFAVYIDFAHTPDALSKLLKCARDFVGEKGRLVVLFGCGGDRDRQKRPEMGKIASALADFTIITSDNSRSEEPSDIIRELMKGVDKERPHLVIENRREAIIYAVRNALPGDVIILAGKGHETYEINRAGKRKFSEEAIVKEALENL